MKHLIIVFLLFAAACYGQAAGYKGSILDSETGRPLSNASVIIKGEHIGTTSNEEGVFTIPANSSSEASVTISYIGYKTAVVALSRFSVDQPLKIYLEPEIIASQTVLVQGAIGEKGTTPMAFSTVKRAEIQKEYTYQDIPAYLSSLPSVTSYSESGNNVGYNYLSIRGFDQRRISVSVNGIPQNDPEDHNVYWLDFPDLLGSTELIQVQRGSGSGVIGYPSVGGSINIITSSFTDKPSFIISSSVGSFNSKQYKAAFSSGLIDNRYSFYMKLAKIMSSGYRDKAWSNFNSFHLSGVRFDKDLTTQINIYGGPVADGLAYSGLPKFAIKDKKLRKENYSDWGATGNSYDYTVTRRSDEIENFSQPHFELLNDYKINNNISVNSVLFLVLGEGFFDYDASWADTSYFRLTSDNGFNPTTNPGNALIRAQVENRQWGWIPRLSYKFNGGEFLTGAEIRVHRSLHWGAINYADNLPAGITKEYKYYQYRGGKNIYNFFAHLKLDLSSRLNLLTEAQAAYNSNKIYEEKYVGNEFTVKNLFINPRLGLNYKLSDLQSIFVSVARVSREPRLNNYYDAAESSYGEVPQFSLNADGSYDFSSPLVKPETMNDIEIGTSYNSGYISLGVNAFYMIFDDEIVKSGQVDRFGQPSTGNVDRSVHKGIEFSGIVNITPFMDLVVNATYSRNNISEGKTFIKYKDPVTKVKSVKEVSLNDNPISGFPEMLVNGSLRFNTSRFSSYISVKYTGKFYSDNFGDKLSSLLVSYPGFSGYDDNRVDASFTADFFVSYELKLNSIGTTVKLTGQVNNIFNNLYASYAIGKEFFPAAERNYTAGIQLGL